MRLLGIFHIDDANLILMGTVFLCGRAGNITQTTGVQNPAEGAHELLSSQIMRLQQVH